MRFEEEPISGVNLGDARDNLQAVADGVIHQLETINDETAQRNVRALNFAVRLVVNTPPDAAQSSGE